MRCLADARIQALVDNEATPEERTHAAECERCGERVRQREQRIEVLQTAMRDAPPMPHGVAHRVSTALRSGHGATRLRTDAAVRLGRGALWSSAALVVATLALIVFVPLLMQDRGAVTAASVLAESADRLARPAVSGVEVLEYELVLDRVPRDFAAEHATGTYRIWKAIDHSAPGRYRFTSYLPNGTMFTSIAQDPSRGTRTILVTVDGQAYRFDFTIDPDAALSLPELEQLHMQASIGMMQASGDQRLEIVDTPDGRRYRIEVPRVSGGSGSAVWDLTEARVVVDANDYRVTEFAVSGSFLRQPYSVRYKLNSRVVSSAVDPDLFEVPTQPGELTFAGEGTMAAPRDALVLALRELGKLKRERQ